jgi:hypothetical protein
MATSTNMSVWLQLILFAKLAHSYSSFSSSGLQTSSSSIAPFHRRLDMNAKIVAVIPRFSNTIRQPLTWKK